MAVRLSALCAGRPSPPGRFLVLISVRGWGDPRAIVRLEGLSQLKSQWPHRESNPRPSGLWHSASTNYATAYPLFIMYNNNNNNNNNTRGWGRLEWEEPKISPIIYTWQGSFSSASPLSPLGPVMWRAVLSNRKGKNMFPRLLHIWRNAHSILVHQDHETALWRYNQYVLK
jgi:hypothetical protein